MKLVYNRTNNAVVYNEDGQMVAAGEFAYVDEVENNEIGEALADGRLVEKPVPEKMPENVSDSAAGALKAAIADQHPEPPEADAKDDTDADKPPVRNTGRSRNTATKSKEA